MSKASCGGKRKRKRKRKKQGERSSIFFFSKTIHIVDLLIKIIISRELVYMNVHSEKKYETMNFWE
jgi:hypothetical protein